MKRKKVREELEEGDDRADNMKNRVVFSNECQHKFDNTGATFGILNVFRDDPSIV